MVPAATILDSIGNTPLVELTHVVPSGCGRVFVKVESHNPTGSMKDRMALAVVDRAAASGRLPASGTVVEYTGGSTGTSLAFVCAVRGFSITVVSSDAFSREKRDQMRALGAHVIEIESEGGRTTKELIRAMMARAAELGASPGAYFADQFNNPDAAAGYAPVAHEVCEQVGGPIDAFVQSVGTAQCIKGVGSVLRERCAGVEIVAVEPAESAVLSGGSPGSHRIEGVGPGFIPPIWSEDLADEIVAVSTAEASTMARRLAREEALFAGTSSGANVVAALRVAERLGPGKVVVTLVCDSGLKYLSTDLYAASPGDRDETTGEETRTPHGPTGGEGLKLIRGGRWSVPIRFNDLLEAYEMVSWSEPGETTVMVCRSSGEIRCHSMATGQDEIPEQAYDSDDWVEVPHKNDLDLGRALVTDFVRQQMPADFDRVEEIFRKRGAYRRYKELLERRGRLQEWYDFEAEQEKRALLEWCQDNDLQVME